MRIVARFLYLLSLSLWLGGYIFFGAIAAPALFRVARQNGAFEIAPLTVALILTRFGVLSAICGGAALLAWLLSKTSGRAWRLQGVALIGAIALASFQNFVLVPQTLREQTAILPLATRAERGEKLSERETALRAAFDRRHKNSERLGGLTILLLLVSLGAFAVSTATRTPRDFEN